MSKYLTLSLCVVSLFVGVIIATVFQTTTKSMSGTVQTPQSMQTGSVAGSDEAFLREMIVHHQAAIQMSHTILGTTKSGNIKTLANSIIGAQTAEIEEMKQWLGEK